MPVLSSEAAAELDRINAIWHSRAMENGAHSVVDLNRPASQLDDVTQREKAILFRHLHAHLNQRERYALDFGCGTGRFSAALAKAINGNVIAYDPCRILAEIGRSQRHPGVLFPSSPPLQVFFENSTATFDLIWIVNVLGGLPADALPWIGGKLTSLLTSKGLLFLAEHTNEHREGHGFWKFRPEAFYPAVFPKIALLPVGAYDDMGNSVTIYAGRKLT